MVAVEFWTRERKLGGVVVLGMGIGKRHEAFGVTLGCN